MFKTKYSLDKIKIIFRYIKSNTVQMFLKKLEIDTLVTSCYSSNQITKCKHNFMYCQDSNGEGGVYVGVVPNWLKEERGDKSIVIEYNPNKINAFAIENLKWLLTVPRVLWRVMSFDLAVDILVPYHTVIMLKRDKREYMCSLGHSKIETRYLGKFGSNGHVKLYDKALERKIDTDWTRFEITIKDIDSPSCTYEEFSEVVKLPVLYRIDTQLSTSYQSLSSVWRLALDTVVNDATMLYTIQDYKTRKKMEQLLFECLDSIKISTQAMYRAYVDYFDSLTSDENDDVVDIASIFYAQDVRNRAINRMRSKKIK